MSTLKNSKWQLAILLVLLYPVGVRSMWRQQYPRWAKVIYTILGLPLFLIVHGYLAVVLLGRVLPELDPSTSPHLERTVWNKPGHYSCTFVKTNQETNGAYELMKVGVEPKGGNWWHYHTSFEETFKVLEGELVVETEGKKQVIKKGDSTVIRRNTLHQFHNATDSLATVLVRITPGAGLEKTIRISYGLLNEGKLGRNGTTNPWHLFFAEQL